ncbi:hypothetical protein ACFYT4_32100, partial [Streptomyces sp. NPDC004609]|uniref:hypothetical protein n=1 Tax=Streptomyces sp. NPDC004609 TaxID=3364704 RepID=UPI0036912B87
MPVDTGSVVERLVGRGGAPFSSRCGGPVIASFSAAPTRRVIPNDQWSYAVKDRVTGWRVLWLCQIAAA